MKFNKIVGTSFVCLLLISISSNVVLIQKIEDGMNQQITLENIPTRIGTRPITTNTNPHTQLNQQPEDLAYVEDLKVWAFDLDHIKKEVSQISVPGAIAMCMESEHSCKGCNAFMVGTEFAHFHPYPDYSMHISLPKEDAKISIDAGWGEWHPLIQLGVLPPNIIMMYAPRNQQELEVSKFILKRSYDFAQGKIAD